MPRPTSRSGRTQYLKREPRREPYDVVLIVCEGQKTEPLYLKRLRSVHRLSSANIEILPSPSQDPINIVDYAEQRCQSDEFDRAFCVFDRDGHHGYERALRRISELKAAGRNID